MPLRIPLQHYQAKRYTEMRIDFEKLEVPEPRFLNSPCEKCRNQYCYCEDEVLYKINEIIDWINSVKDQLI